MADDRKRTLSSDSSDDSDGSIKVVSIKKKSKPNAAQNEEMDVEEAVSVRAVESEKYLVPADEATSTSENKNLLSTGRANKAKDKVENEFSNDVPNISQGQDGEVCFASTTQAASKGNGALQKRAQEFRAQKQVQNSLKSGSLTLLKLLNIIRKDFGYIADPIGLIFFLEGQITEGNGTELLAIDVNLIILSFFRGQLLNHPIRKSPGPYRKSIEALIDSIEAMTAPYWANYGNIIDNQSPRLMSHMLLRTLFNYLSPLQTSLSFYSFQLTGILESYYTIGRRLCLLWKRSLNNELELSGNAGSQLANVDDIATLRYAQQFLEAVIGAVAIVDPQAVPLMTTTRDNFNRIIDYAVRQLNIEQEHDSTDEGLETDYEE